MGIAILTMSCGSYHHRHVTLGWQLSCSLQQLFVCIGSAFLSVRRTWVLWQKLILAWTCEVYSSKHALQKKKKNKNLEMHFPVLLFMLWKNQDTNFDELCVWPFSFLVILPKHCPRHGKDEVFLMSTVLSCHTFYCSLGWWTSLFLIPILSLLH